MRAAVASLRLLPASHLAPPESTLTIGTPAGIEFPRGRVTEIYGPASSGRTSLLYSALAQATSDGESCALVDADDVFDPSSAAAAGIKLHNLLWVRCATSPESVMRVTDLLLHGNSFGLVAIDLASIEPRAANRIPPSYWYRFRRALEQTRTALIVLSPLPNVRQCASLAVETRHVETHWSGTPGCSRLLEGISLDFEIRKPVTSTAAIRLEMRALTA